MKNKKILIVTHQFLPHVSPRTTRWSLLIDYLVDQGNDITVLSGTRPQASAKNYKVLYFGNKRISGVINTVRQNSNDSRSSNLKKLIFRILKHIYRFLFKTFAWPDYAMFWIFTIYKNKKKIHDDYDIIISISLPFTSHVCAYLLTKRLNAEWYMDIGDPFSLKKFSSENNKFLFSFINRFIEKKYYKNASKIIFTHKEASELHMKYFDIPASKVVNGYPIGLIDKNSLSKSINYNYSQKPLKIGYFGIFTDRVRDPENYLKAFTLLKNPVFAELMESTESVHRSFAEVMKDNGEEKMMFGILEMIKDFGGLVGFQESTQINQNNSSVNIRA